MALPFYGFVRRLNESDLSNIAISSYYNSLTIYICIESGVVYFDARKNRYGTSKIKVVDSLEDVDTLSEKYMYALRELPEDLEYGIYFYSVSEGFTEMTERSFPTILEKIYPTLVLTPALFKRKDIPYAPETLASVTYLNNGDTVEERLKYLYQLGVATIDFDVAYDGQDHFVKGISSTSLTENAYIFLTKASTYIELRIGSTIIDKSRYKLTTSAAGTVTFINITILQPEEYYLKEGRTIHLVAWYNSNIDLSKDELDNGMSGAYITPGTIPTEMLAHYSNRIDYDNTSSVATSKAVNDLYETINQKLESNRIYRCAPTSLSTTSEIFVAIPDYTLQHGDVYYITLTTDIVESTVININGTKLSVYERTSSTLTKLTSGIYSSGEVLKAYYDSIEKKLITLYPSDVDYKISSITDIHNVVNDLESEFTINVDGFSSSKDSVTVYHNNLILFDSLNYQIIGNTLKLIGYGAEKGDTVVIVVQRITKI